jgi:hypothetical protein
MYRRIAFAAATLSLAAGGLLMVWVVLRPHADLQRLYGAVLGLAGLLVGAVLLIGAMRVPASTGQMTWRRLQPRWPVALGVVVIALVTIGLGMAAAAAITRPDPQPAPQPAAPVPVPGTVPQPASS